MMMMQFVVQMVMEITTDPEDQQGARTVPHPLRPNLQHKEKGHIGTDDPVDDKDRAYNSSRGPHNDGDETRIGRTDPNRGDNNRQTVPRIHLGAALPVPVESFLQIE